MADGKTTETRGVPYLPASTFKNFVAQFKSGTIPPRIDRSLMTSMSGADQSMLRQALRFFDLVDPDRNDAVTDKFRDLATSSGTDRWKESLRAVIEGAYSSIVEGLDKTATPAQLDEHFRERAKVTGSVLDKAVRFYLTMAEEAGVELSPLFKKRTSASQRKNSGQKSRRNSREDFSPNPPADQLSPPGTKTLRFTVPSGEVQVIVPATITAKEIGRLGSYIKDYFDLLNEDEDA